MDRTLTIKVRIPHCSFMHGQSNPELPVRVELPEVFPKRLQPTCEDVASRFNGRLERTTLLKHVVYDAQPTVTRPPPKLGIHASMQLSRSVHFSSDRIFKCLKKSIHNIRSILCYDGGMTRCIDFQEVDALVISIFFKPKSLKRFERHF